MPSNRAPANSIATDAQKIRKCPDASDTNACMILKIPAISNINPAYLNTDLKRSTKSETILHFRSPFGF